VIVHINYVIPSIALENFIFLPYGPYSAIIRPSSSQLGLKVWLLIKLSN